MVTKRGVLSESATQTVYKWPIAFFRNSLRVIDIFVHSAIFNLKGKFTKFWGPGQGREKLLSRESSEIKNGNNKRTTTTTLRLLGWGWMISHSYSPQPDTGVRCEFLSPGNVSVVAAA